MFHVLIQASTCYHMPVRGFHALSFAKNSVPHSFTHWNKVTHAFTSWNDVSCANNGFYAYPHIKYNFSLGLNDWFVLLYRVKPLIINHLTSQMTRWHLLVRLPSKPNRLRCWPTILAPINQTGWSIGFFQLDCSPQLSI